MKVIPSAALLAGVVGVVARSTGTNIEGSSRRESRTCTIQRHQRMDGVPVKDKPRWGTEGSSPSSGLALELLGTRAVTRR